MPYRYSDPNTRSVWDQATGRFQSAGRIARFWRDAAGTVPVQLGAYLEDTPDVPGPPLGGNALTVAGDSMWPAVWDLGSGDAWVYVQVGTIANPGGLYRIACDSDQRIAVQAQRVTTVETALAGKPGKTDYWVNVRDHGAVGNGVVDDTLAIRSALATLKTAAGNEVGGGVIYFPPGTYLCNQVDSNGAILTVSGKLNVTLRGGGNNSRIRTSTATATELLRMEGCNLGSIQDLSFQVIGTARVQHAVHMTTVGDVGSIHGFLFDHLNISCNGAYRRAFDIAVTAGSTTLYSAQAAFAAGDVGGSITLNLPQPLVTNIQAVATISGTLAADVTTTTATTLTLAAPLSGTPASGFTVRVGTERMYVSAGGTTTTLTVTRGRGPDQTATTHSAGAQVVTYTATIADPVPTAFTNAALAGRIQPAGAARMLNGLSIGTDHPGSPDLDIAQTTVSACVISRAARAAVAIGNGTSADILDNWAYGIGLYESFAGLYADGGFLTIHGGDCSTNVVDFKRYTVVSQEAKITGVRSENPAMFYDFSVGGNSGPSTTITDVQVRTFNAEDGIVVRHVHSSPLTLIAIDLSSSNIGRGATYISVTGASAGAPCHLTAINVAYNGANNDLFPVGPPLALRTIIGSPRILTGTGNAFSPNTVVGFHTDLRFQAAGGFARGRRAVADTATTVTTADSVIGYTSLTAARVVTLPAQGVTLPAGQEFVIKDESGACDGTKTITVTPTSGTIDGAANLVLNSAYANVTVYTNGSNWFTR
ncbi:glycosyl hydrolase family 28-related protein [Micromonospora profundi]|uniref:glycosyl hydrolase family 28-related protein n=1 Tax=Micromonospora profundi TaxID=1420889 RepID=UPI003647D495